MNKNILLRFLIDTALFGCSALLSANAFGYPNGPAEFCQHYNKSPLCAQSNPTCALCHNSASGGSRNPYGDCLQKTQVFAKDIAGALEASENKDCDGDGVSNIDEIFAGTFPGDFSNKPSEQIPVEHPAKELSCEDRNKLSDWNVCGYDTLHVFKKINVDFCRKPAGLQEIDTFRSLSTEAQFSALRDTLNDCLASEKWIGKDGVVWRLGHAVINPLQAIKSGENGGSIPLGDYDDDYALWMFFNIEDRDVRGVLTTKHFVKHESSPTKYIEIENVPLHPKASGVPKLVEMFYQSGEQQFVPEDMRAGLLTTNWTLVSRTMFTSTPRATANAALRAFLGIDISKGEGLTELYPNDPNFVLVDHDNKGILTKECSFCHQALDPVTFPFTQYNGLTVSINNNQIAGLFINSLINGASKDCGKLDTSTLAGSFSLTGDLSQIDCYISKATPAKRAEFLNHPETMLPSVFKAKRIEIMAKQNAATEPNLKNTPTSGYLFGEPVANLVEWAEVAADSDAFARQMTLYYWMLLVGKHPSGEPAKEFDQLWKNLKQKNNYSINAMLHELIATEVYGAP